MRKAIRKAAAGVLTVFMAVLAVYAPPAFGVSHITARADEAGEAEAICAKLTPEQAAGYAKAIKDFLADEWVVSHNGDINNINATVVDVSGNNDNLLIIWFKATDWDHAPTLIRIFDWDNTAIKPLLDERTDDANVTLYRQKDKSIIIGINYYMWSLGDFESGEYYSIYSSGSLVSTFWWSETSSSSQGSSFWFIHYSDGQFKSGNGSIENSVVLADEFPQYNISQPIEFISESQSNGGKRDAGKEYTTYNAAVVLAALYKRSALTQNTDKGSQTAEASVKAISAGALHSMAIKTDGSLWAWGYNDAGQLGNGTTSSRSTPTKVMGDIDSISIAAGGLHSLAIKTDGSLWAWGLNNAGELGDGTTYDRHAPVKVMNDLVSVAAGDHHSLALNADGTLWAWGDNEFGQLGDGTPNNRLNPVKVLDNVASVVAGCRHTLALKNDGTLWAWGNNEFGQLGDGTTTNRYAPIKVMSGVASVAAGGWHSLAIKTDGSLLAWGYNGVGQLGDGTTADRYLPIKVSDDVASVARGYYSTFAI